MKNSRTHVGYPMLAGEFSVISGDYSDLWCLMNLLLLMNCVFPFQVSPCFLVHRIWHRIRGPRGHLFCVSFWSHVILFCIRGIWNVQNVIDSSLKLYKKIPMYELGNQCLCTLSTAPTCKWNREEANSQANFPTVTAYSTLGALTL